MTDDMDVADIIAAALRLDDDGLGTSLTVEQQRARLAVTAFQLQQQYGDEVYQRIFAPAYVVLLGKVNTQAGG